MRCIVCGSRAGWSTIFEYTEPDKYENWVGLKDINRKWMLCDCGMYQQERNYPLSFLEKIYEDGYRNPDFRGETINEAFNRINAIKDNENDTRKRWFNGNIGDYKSLLDAGAGIGIFPASLVDGRRTIWATEANRTSRDFINSIGIPCVTNMPRFVKFDVISMIHLLEHFDNPIPILQEAKSALKPGGRLFVEVPHAIEFEYLGQDSDEFNSCHCLFFNQVSLQATLNKGGFNVLRAGELHYPDRNRTRIVAVCQSTQHR